MIIHLHFSIMKQPLSYINNPTILLDTNRRGLRIDCICIDARTSDLEAIYKNALKFDCAFIVDTLQDAVV